MSTMRKTHFDPDSIDYEAIADPGHGNTVAAWTGVFIMLIGTTIAAVGNVIFNDVIFYAGIGVVVLGLIVGIILRLAGFGKNGKRSKDH